MALLDKLPHGDEAGADTWMSQTTLSAESHTSESESLPAANGNVQKDVMYARTGIIMTTQRGN